MLGRDDATSDSNHSVGALSHLVLGGVERVVLPLAAFLLRQLTAVPLAACPESPGTPIWETESHRLSGSDQVNSILPGRRRSRQGSRGSLGPAFLAPLNHVQGTKLHPQPLSSERK